MASTNPPIRAVAYTIYVSLVSQADTKLFKTSVTLATGDVTVSKDGGAFANIGTLPVEISTTGVLSVALTGTEMTADTVVVRFRDAAGAEWCDLVLTIHTVAANFDSLSARIPAALVSGRIDASVGAMAANVVTDTAIATGALTAAKFASGAFDAVWSVAARTLTAFGFSVTASSVTDKTGYALSAAGVQAVWDALTSALTTVGSIGKLFVDNINATIVSRASQASVDTVDDFLDTEMAAVLAAVDTEVAAIKAKTDNLPAAPAATGDIPTAAANADAVWDEARAGHVAAGSFGEGVASVQGNVTGSVASVTGAVGSVTAPVTAGTVSDKTGYALAVAPPTVAQILTTALTESYAAQGAAPTLTQAVLEILQFLTEKDVAGTAVTANKRDGVTPATNYTLNSATTPTAIERAA